MLGDDRVPHPAHHPGHHRDPGRRPDRLLAEQADPRRRGGGGARARGAHPAEWPTSTWSTGSTCRSGTSSGATSRGSSGPPQPGLLVQVQPGRASSSSPQRLPKTLTLVGVSTLVALIIAVPLGILQVVRRYTLDRLHADGGSPSSFYAMPAFLLGSLLILYFAFDIHLFPVSPPINSTAWTIFTDPRAFVLPVITLSAITIASFSRYMRSSMMDALAEDYVRTARAKGASNNRVLYGHALRNALIPILTLIGLSLPAIASGALITETVFNYPGMGLLTVHAAVQRRHPRRPRDHAGHHHLHRGRFPAGRHPLCHRRSTHPSRERDDMTTHDETSPPAEPLDRTCCRPARRADLARRRSTAPSPEGGESSSVGRHGPTDPPGVRGEPAGRRRPRSSSSFFMLFCFVGPLALPHQPDQLGVGPQRQPERRRRARGHPLGTDDTGFDMLGRLMFGGQASLIVGFASAAVATVVGVHLRGRGRVHRRLGRRPHDADRRHAALHPGALPPDRPGDDLPASPRS